MACLAAPVLLFLLLNLLFPFKIKIDYSAVVSAPEGTTLHAFLNKTDKWRLQANSTEITPLLRQVILYKEDKYFYYHPGINPLAVLRAAVNNVREGRKTSGASTITMQVVRLLEPRERTFSSKLVETFRALQLE
ncbi:MAG: transglycosylase domain-containing protein, partial [Hymenobacteraceae bacterium]|nr:transglycosylase domain-containing protein [Hymenobacteraceae bacterium]MDX5395353.1 transglycosylase domain-containing protein [Hymenobacteraceae bacterium]MDX5511404.1 transglycosylase domain-containing protein [Hymenobacteraceae bacterium]